MGFKEGVPYNATWQAIKNPLTLRGLVRSDISGTL
ncbi:MAG: hypothetical protein ACJAZI_001025 [Cycloclasticus sp.]|jgi:hypothetical protein